MASDSRLPTPDSPVSVLDAIASLVDRSLLSQTDDAAGEPRFSMMETVRAFALERLTAHGETDSTYRAMTSWCLALAKADGYAFFDSLGSVALNRLDVELGNIRASFSWLNDTGDTETALRLAVALGSFWHVRGHLSEGRDRLERALVAHPDASPELRARTFYWLGQLAVHGSDDPRAFALLEESLNLHNQIGDRAGAVATTILLGGAAEFRGNDDLAMALYRRALDGSRELKATRLTLWSLINLADGAYRQGAYEASSAFAEEALVLAESSGDRGLRVFAQIVAIQAVLHQGETEKAYRIAADCLSTCRASGIRLGVVAALIALAAVHLAFGQPERAARLLGAADTARELLGVRVPLNHGLQHQTQIELQSLLPRQVYDASWAAGRSLTVEQAIDEAMAKPESPATREPRATPHRSTDPQALTTREREVLRLLITGLTDRQIAESLFISHRTTQVHVANIFAKLGVNSRTAAATAAHRLGLDLDLPTTT